MTDKPIINCHTHIFTGDHVPPYLAKRYVPWPFYFLLPVKGIVSFFRFWYKYPARLPYTIPYKQYIKGLTRIKAFFLKLWPLNDILSFYLFLFTFFLLFGLVQEYYPADEGWFLEGVQKAYAYSAPLFPNIQSTGVKVLLTILVLLFFREVRNLIFILAKRLWQVLGKLPGPHTRDLVRRYLNIGRYAFHHEQKTIFSKLKSQYPPGTGFVVLPMDMAYMEAGESPIRYRDQMAALQEIRAKNQVGFHPFVFADPRRIGKVENEKNYQPGDKPYFEWELKQGKVVLQDCFLKDYLETHRFSGIKIYPALGYYPFDEKLLPLWMYCAQHGIPIITHCIRGTIFYRGRKKDEWNAHPVFKQAMAKKKITVEMDGFPDVEILEEEQVTRYEPLILSQFKHIEFSYNFTHPLNYLCLLEEELLRELVTASIAKNPNSKLKELFGYKDPKQPLAYNLSQLKICLAHFGGEDEWQRFFEKDRYDFSSQLVKYPDTGIRFLKNVKGICTPGKLEQLWKHTDWYSLICSLMLQYPQVYADISYILHSEEAVLPLLKQTLQNPRLRNRVLFGTDFFVVRNHKSEKNMLAEQMGGLSPEDFDQIARTNPIEFLTNCLP